jgi:hypothetical protein
VLRSMRMPALSLVPPTCKFKNVLFCRQSCFQALFWLPCIVPMHGYYWKCLEALLCDAVLFIPSDPVGFCRLVPWQCG